MAKSNAWGETGEPTVGRKRHRTLPSVGTVPESRSAKVDREKRARLKCVDVAVILLVIADVNTLMLIRELGDSTVRLSDADGGASERLLSNDIVAEHQGVLAFTPFGRQLWLSIRGLIE